MSVTEPPPSTSMRSSRASRAPGPPATTPSSAPPCSSTGESLCEALDVAAGERVLDVAAGNGNVALAAARRGGDVTATDYVPALLDGTPPGRRPKACTSTSGGGRRGPAVRRRHLRRHVSTFGVMFTPEPGASAAELVRVAGRVAGSASRTGRRRASSARCSRSSAATSRRRPASAPRWSGARGAARRAVRRRGPGRGAATRVRVPLPLGRALARHVPRLLRPDATRRSGPRRRGQGAFAADLLTLAHEPQHSDHGHPPHPRSTSRSSPSRPSRRGRNPQPAPPDPFSRGAGGVARLDRRLAHLVAVEPDAQHRRDLQDHPPRRVEEAGELRLALRAPTSPQAVGHGPGRPRLRLRFAASSRFQP